MAKYDLLHEAKTPEHDLAEKYDVMTFDQYKGFKNRQDNKLVPISKAKDWTPVQELAFTIIYFMHCAGDKQRYLIINREMAIDLLDQLGDIPKEFEGVPLAFEEKELFRISSLA